MKNKYLMKVQFIFDGEIEIIAEDKADAERHFKDNIGLVMGGHIHTAGLNDNEVDWDFPAHPDKRIIKIKKLKSNVNILED